MYVLLMFFYDGNQVCFNEKVAANLNDKKDRAEQKAMFSPLYLASYWNW